MVALLLGCGLRRSEVLALELQSVQQRHEHRVIDDLLGKAGHVRTVPAIQGADGDGIVRPCATTRELLRLWGTHRPWGSVRFLCGSLAFGLCLAKAGSARCIAQSPPRDIEIYGRTPRRAGAESSPVGTSESMALQGSEAWIGPYPSLPTGKRSSPRR